MRSCLAIEPDTSLPGLRVIEVLERLTAQRGLPRTMMTDHGPEFTGRALDLWVHDRGVGIDFVRAGKPADNAFVESFYGRLRGAAFLALG